MSILTVESLANTYALGELKEKRREVADKLLQLDMVTSASGAGSSYTRAERLKAEELLNLLEQAIAKKEGRTPDIGQGVSVVAFRNTDY